MSSKDYPSGREQELVCRKCGKRGLRRESRRGFLEEVILWRLNYFPWECAHCRTRQLLRAEFQPKTPSSD